ncbi:formylmethionine deformylase [Nocardia sp. MH4]|uniref:Peptide deformylase n=1 Tax=Nocardia fluminea TaxID=134984 RepID=A0A2N3VCZ8_9NOCA|nr:MULTISPECIES: peptide deformylase [Nocardia]MBW0275268.1 formylmethionine deformylase [Nocardia sp. MH4]PKV79475.1 peptide deformylase [Nocardia fluminea]
MTPAGTSPANEPANTQVNVFALELRRWRDVRGLSLRALAAKLGYSRPYVSKIESGTEKPSEAFAARAESILQAGGALRAAFAEFIAARPGTVRSPVAVESRDSAGSLVVDHDDASLSFDGLNYRLRQRRRLINDGSEPITRYLIRISVDRYPGDPERSNHLYQENPLTWEEIDLHAWYGENRTEPMTWTAHHDRDAFKEVWLMFSEPDSGRHFPLYPGQACWIDYEYTVSAAHWGNWFQRAVRLPTNRLSVRLDFPAELEPSVWGLETSMTAEGQPFRTPITHQAEPGRAMYSWSTDHPPLHARYRLEWDFRGRSDDERTPPSRVMAGLGIAQEGDEILREVARPFDLPAEAEDARRVIAELNSAAQRVAQAHVFGKGMGIAAPQIGISRAAAIVRTPNGDTITLFNPRIVETGGGEDEQYEGCLSFFDLRGRVPRPLTIHVEHTDIDGNTRIAVFDRGVARLVAHEVDHLHATLYLDHLKPGVEPISVEQYRGTGANWAY